jgi:hypothetical protein
VTALGWVYVAPCTDPHLNQVYGPSATGPILLPLSEKGEALLARAKQTEAERLECKKRGAE